VTESSLIERVARAICLADDVDPDQIGVGLGRRMPKGETYPLWHARIEQAKAAIAAMRACVDGTDPQQGSA
jgi:hypothetical protein